jgi:hypothetical protein
MLPITSTGRHPRRLRPSAADPPLLARTQEGRTGPDFEGIPNDYRKHGPYAALATSLASRTLLKPIGTMIIYFLS